MSRSKWRPNISKTHYAGVDFLNTAPAPNEFEISIFGPGYGEGIALHLGHNEWIVVDSCEDSETKEPASLKYLKQIGVDPASAVKLVVVSHWHDDHIRGIARILKECATAIFSCSPALNCRDFVALTQLYKNAPITMPAGVKEYGELMDVLLARPRRDGDLSTPIWAFPGRRLLETTYSDTESGTVLSAEVRSLSPSDYAIQKGYEDIGKAFQKALEGRLERLVPFSPNHISVALWVQLGDFSVLLGSDLEETRDPRLGWSAILSSTKPTGTASVFKVPHHGSKTAHSHDVWANMVEGANPIALLTPFQNAGVSLPESKDRQRIRSYTNAAYITATSTSGRQIRRPPKVERLYRQTAKPLARSGGPVGHIRFRVPHHMPMTAGVLQLFSGAALLPST